MGGGPWIQQYRSGRVQNGAHKMESKEEGLGRGSEGLVGKGWCGKQGARA